jgi:adenylate kinase
MVVAQGKVIVFLGAPGAGKGTQARQLKEALAIPQISTGDILRSMANSDSELGCKIRQVQAAGKLVADDILAAVILERTSQNDCQAGYILDGYPRTLPQATTLSEIIAQQGFEILVLNVEVTRDTLTKRLVGRRTCSNSHCGEIYNVFFKPAQQENICDLCGGPLAQRSDDNEAAITQRLDVYLRSTAPLIDYYQQLNRLLVIDGDQPSSEIFTNILAIVQNSR